MGNEFHSFGTAWTNARSPRDLNRIRGVHSSKRSADLNVRVGTYGVSREPVKMCQDRGNMATSVCIRQEPGSSVLDDLQPIQGRDRNTN
uniref:Uncharacterized protein n=1 Tax=Nothobranchius rachovii TaxID=451742 RepID=A0A1A8RQY1_9TELE